MGLKSTLSTVRRPRHPKNGGGSDLMKEGGFQSGCIPPNMYLLLVKSGRELDPTTGGFGEPNSFKSSTLSLPVHDFIEIRMLISRLKK